MNAHTERLTLQGAAGAIQALRDPATLAPGQTAPRGVVIIAHPHPLFGGTMENKVVQTLARAFVQCGWHAVRFNFRGLGASQGSYDEGRGELQDLLAVIAHEAPQGPLALAGLLGKALRPIRKQNRPSGMLRANNQGQEAANKMAAAIVGPATEAVATTSELMAMPRPSRRTG